jgi:hypothetical protein
MCIAFVRSARESGMRVVWIECPDDEARRRYLKRGTHPIESFEIQVPLIRTNYERIMAEVQPEVVDVLNPDGTPRSTEELFLLATGSR